jgi:hypothetical protein
MNMKLVFSAFLLVAFAFSANASEHVSDKLLPIAKPTQDSPAKQDFPPTAEVVSAPPAHNVMVKNYMSQFCANNIGGSACQESQKQQACERFKNAAVNVQQLLDRTIDCEVNAENAIEADCDGLDAGRLDLLKQYWQDEDMSYTIVFLPDMVQNIVENCPIKNGQEKQSQAGGKK